MKSVHIPSYLVGLLSGALIVAVMGLARGESQSGSMSDAPANGGRQSNFGEQQGRFDSVQRMERMAQRFGMTPQELQKELDGGKTMQQIAEEKGVDMAAGGFGPRGGSGARTERTSSGSGARYQSGSVIQKNEEM